MRFSASTSGEAQKFLRESLGVDWEAADLSPAGLTCLRQENSEVAQKQQRDLPKVETSWEKIGNVNVQWVGESSPERPIVLYFYGGAFVVGSPDDDFQISSEIARRTGLRICVPQYRLAPEHPYPAAVDDARAVYEALQKRKESIILFGESAGGNLALQLALFTPSSSPPLACVLLSPWIDLTHSGSSHVTLEQCDPTLSVQHFLQPCAMAYAGAATLETVSPLLSTFPGQCLFPTYISSGTRDLLLSDSCRLATKLRKLGGKVELDVSEDMWHVFEWYNLPEAKESLEKIAKFIISKL
jgi:acetyl esterase/lipase